MHSCFKDYKKKKEFLICVDSDGCAMDTMDIKHIRCFGPCMVEEWELKEWAAPILSRWNDINLYTMTRGINRFKGLVTALKEINEQYKKIEGLKELEAWVKESKELSNAALKLAAENTGGICLKKALSWSEQVNEDIKKISKSMKTPFKGAGEGLQYAHDFADIAVVSSANRQAVEEEWELYSMLCHTDIVLTQDVGSKAFCIGELLKMGYDKDHVLMVGDALGDYEAAKKNGVYYYPILVKKEEESWKEFRHTAVDKFLRGTFGSGYEDEKYKEFKENLKE